MTNLPKFLLVVACMSLLASCTTGRKPASNAPSTNSSGMVIATHSAEYGNIYYFLTGNCAYYPSAKDFPNVYVLQTPSGSVLQRGCYSYNKRTNIAVLDDKDRTTLDFSKSTPPSAESKPQAQQSSKTVVKTAPQKTEPVANVASPFSVTSVPAGAKIMTASGEVLGETPALISFNHRPDSADSNGCFTSPKFKLVWASGAEFISSPKTKLCPQNGRFELSVKRPRVPGLQIDIDYIHKQDMLRVQQEQLKLQRQQAEEQRRFMAEQSAHAAAQEKAANEALLMQAYQMMQPKPSGTRLPISCDRSLVTGSYSCY